MSRYSKVIKKRKKTAIPFFPESLQAFIARRFIDGAGLFLLFCGLCFLASLASYSHNDPSLNTASAMGVKGVQNILGTPGAYMADLFLQTLGLAGTIPGIVIAVWGASILKRRPVMPVWTRIAAMLPAMLLAAAALALVTAHGWLVHPYLGGSGGTMILDKFAAGFHVIAPAIPRSIIAALSGVIALGFLLHACAVTMDEIKASLAFVRDNAIAAGVLAWGAVLRFIDWVRTYGDPEFAAAERKVVVKREKKARVAPAVQSRDDDEEIEKEIEEDEEEEESPGSGIRVVAPKKKAQTPRRQTSFALQDTGEWELPPAELLQEAPEIDEDDALDEDSLQANALMLHGVLKDFNVSGEIVSIHPGPVVTLYELEPAPGTKSARVIGLSDDIARSMAAVSVRCANVPGRNVIGIELPNQRRQTVYMREILETGEVEKSKAKLPLILGKDIGGRAIVADLSRMPHLLIAGTTGSGKSVAINTMILSLVYHLSPAQCRFIMIDPKMLELSVYDDIPHLLSPVVTEPGKAVISLKWAVQEMENRYRSMSKLGVRNIEGYNERLKQARNKGETLMRKVQTGFDSESGKPVFEDQPMDMTELPYIVVVVDEFADLMLVAGKDVENAVQRLAQMARAAGIHLLMATQRPSVDVITGVIKANFPTRISFQVTSKIDSRTILGEGGAEQLLGMGDMLYMAAGGRITRVHGPFVADDEVEEVVNFLKAQGEPSYIEDVTEGSFGDGSEVMNAMFGGEGGGSGVDELYDQAVALVARERKASTSFIQRYLQIGYNRAARIIEEMERQGVVSKANAVGKREVLVGDYSDA